MIRERRIGGKMAQIEIVEFLTDRRVGDQETARTSPSETFVIARLANREALALAYGREAVEKVRDEVLARARASLGSPSAAWWLDEIDLLLRISYRGSADAHPSLGEVQRRLAQPITVGEYLILPLLVAAAGSVDAGQSVSVGEVEPVIDALRQRVVRAQPALPAIGADAVSCARYRRDMASAAMVSDLLNCDGVVMAWQPVRSSDGSDEILYSEGLSRFIDTDGEALEPGIVVPALERTGLIRLLDHCVVLQTLERLRVHEYQRLGCNISAQSALLDEWWDDAIALLEANRELAQRFVIEITETAAFTDVNRTVQFVDHMRSLGCRIAIDDFGTGHAALRHVVALKPDIVKIDALFLRRCLEGDDADTETFRHLVGLAAACADAVVVEGVESEIGLVMALAAGAAWAQGYHLAAPALFLGRGDSQARSPRVNPWGAAPVPTIRRPDNERDRRWLAATFLLSLFLWIGIAGAWNAVT